MRDAGTNLISSRKKSRVCLAVLTEQDQQSNLKRPRREGLTSETSDPSRRDDGVVTKRALFEISFASLRSARARGFFSPPFYESLANITFRVRGRCEKSGVPSRNPLTRDVAP